MRHPNPHNPKPPEIRGLIKCSCGKKLKKQRGKLLGTTADGAKVYQHSSGKRVSKKRTRKGFWAPKLSIKDWEELYNGVCRALNENLEVDYRRAARLRDRLGRELFKRKLQ